MTRRRGLIALAAVLATAFLAAGCAIPTQSAPSSIAASKVPFDLLDPHLPTTTTTLPKPSSLVPVTVFFLNSTSQLQSEPRVVAAPAPLSSVLNTMLAGPTIAEAAGGVFTAIPSDVTLLSDLDAGRRGHGEHEQRLRGDHGHQHGAGRGPDRRHGGHRERPGTGVVFEIEGQHTSVPIANGSQVGGTGLPNRFPRRRPT